MQRAGRGGQCGSSPSEVGGSQMGRRCLYGLLAADGDRRHSGQALAGIRCLGLVRGGGHRGPNSPAGAGSRRRPHFPPPGGFGCPSPGRAGQPAQPTAHVRPRVDGGGCHRLRCRSPRKRLRHGHRKSLFGASYAEAASVVGLLSFSGALLGLVMVLLHYHLTRGNRLVAAFCWPAILIVIIGTSIWHHSMTEIAIVTVIATSSACAGMLVIAWGRAELPRGNLIEQANLALLDANLDLTVVVPYYNPGHLLVPTIEQLLSVLDASGASYEVIAVSDGSTDGSDRELEATLAGRPQLTNIVLAQNQGKGAALRIGLAKGSGRYLGFIDADGDLDPILLDSFQTMVRLYSPDIILGSKRHPLSEVEYPFLRRVYSWGYQQVVRIGFRLNIRDTQTGIKLVRRDVLSAVLPRMLEKRFAFDLELFVIARRLGYKRFLEAPIRLRHQFTSTVSWRSVYRSLLDTMAIWYRLRILHYYDGDQAPATPGSEQLLIDPIVLRGSAGTAAGSAGSAPSETPQPASVPARPGREDPPGS